jgi:hypothetical protein
MSKAIDAALPSTANLGPGGRRHRDNQGNRPPLQGSIAAIPIQIARYTLSY